MRTRQQARLASRILVAAAIVLTLLNMAFTSARSPMEHVPDYVCIVALLAGAVTVRMTRVPDRAIPWVCGVIALVIVAMMVLQTWQDPADLGAQYALVIMAVYAPFVLNFPAMITVAVPMIGMYGVVLHEVRPDMWADAVVLGMTALVIGGVIMWLRLAGIDSLSDSFEETASLATNDPLTGLLNRRAFSERAIQLVADADRHGEQVVALFVDVDHLKAINDGHGHATGDRVLTLVASAMHKAVRGSDLMCRWGGDEFVVLGISNDPNGFAAHIRHTVACEAEQLPQWNGHVSIGCATANSHRLNWQDIVARADEDMYGQRERHRGREGD